MSEILLVDIGNSRIKWARALGTVLLKTGAWSHSEGGISALAVRHWQSPPCRLIAANVAGDVLASELGCWVRSNWGLEVEFLVPQAFARGVRNSYHEPALLGSDRWAALLGVAHRKFGRNVCIAHCGTTLVIDVLRVDNVHLGGLIIPGMKLMLDSLRHGTASLDKLLNSEIQEENDCGLRLASSTSHAVYGGVLYAISAFIENVIRDLQRELGPELLLLLTGGDAAQLFLSLSKSFNISNPCRIIVDTELVLLGLAVAAMPGND